MNTASNGRAYRLGVDLGTTYTCAAVERGGVVSVVQLTSDSQTIPSIVALADDGSMVVGEVAMRRALSDPTRAAREFKRRFGDTTPIVLGGTRTSPEALTEALLREVLARVETVEGSAPAALVLSHPAAWGPFRLDKLREISASLGHPDVELIAEPVAAAAANADRLTAGSLVAVYDLGGGTFDAAVVRVETNELLGHPEGVERLGGIDFDALVMQHVDDATGGLVNDADIDDPETRAALARLLDDCRNAKEALSSDSETEIPVNLPSVRTSVRLTRSEFEALVRPRLADSLAVLDRVIASAGVDRDEIDQVLLIGGSSRIPLVGQLVREHLGRPVMTATNPNHAVAIGAARAVPAPASVEAPIPEPVAAVAPTPAAPAPAAPTTATKPKRGVLFGSLGVAAAIAVGIGAAVSSRGGGGDDTAASTTAAATTIAAVTSAATTTTAAATSTSSSGPIGPFAASPCSTSGDLAGLSAISVDGDRAAAVVDGNVVLLRVDQATCAVTLDLSFAGGVVSDVDADYRSVSLLGNTLVAATDSGGTIVDLATTTSRDCADLRSTVALQPGGKSVWTWSEGSNGFSTIGIDAEPCAVKTADAFPKFEIRGFVIGSDASFLGFSDGVLQVMRLEGAQVVWQVGGTDAFRSIDGVSACGDDVCVLDSVAQRITVFTVDGDEVANVDVASLGLGEATKLFTENGSASGWLVTSGTDGAVISRLASA